MRNGRGAIAVLNAAVLAAAITTVAQHQPAKPPKPKLVAVQTKPLPTTPYADIRLPPGDSVGSLALSATRAVLWADGADGPMGLYAATLPTGQPQRIATPLIKDVGPQLVVTGTTAVWIESTDQAPFSWVIRAADLTTGATKTLAMAHADDFVPTISAAADRVSWVSSDDGVNASVYAYDLDSDDQHLIKKDCTCSLSAVTGEGDVLIDDADDIKDWPHDHGKPFDVGVVGPAQAIVASGRTIWFAAGGTDGMPRFVFMTSLDQPGLEETLVDRPFAAESLVAGDGFVAVTDGHVEVAAPHWRTTLTDALPDTPVGAGAHLLGYVTGTEDDQSVRVLSVG